ncbi:hypothetical protein [Marinobacter zhanjiangensis]|uniref:Gluconate 2-dehydrogenase subunit 3 n=1 Tax=Marinobacter zhanjiangensis TaxID=578215 RepID=A0ABQ3B2X4_9GAMM|nr:hypothetical protein [Marinobacter zhanjiangensis]GGY75276.1 hypothetical protein GCM10007071_23120 [Marinobacter zhanjiangensis]
MSEDKPSNVPINSGRRQLLIGSGLLGAAAAVNPGMAFAGWRRGHWGWGHPEENVEPVDWTVEQLRTALDALRDDTFFAMIAFGVPGDDPYSEYQGVSTPYPGGITTRADLYLSGGTDLLVPMPTAFMNQMLASIATYLRLSPMDIPEMASEDVGENGEWILENLDRTFTEYLEGEVSNSVLVALLLNLAATRVAGSIDGPFPSPFANLSWDQKARVFEELENQHSWLRRAITWAIPDWHYREAAPGVLNLMISFMLRVSGFGSYCEFAVFNPATREVAQRPLGWVLSQYAPDAPPSGIGSDDFIGYFQGRRSV